MNNELWMLWLASCILSFLVGRWRGIKDFEAEMVKQGLLPPQGPGAV